MTQTFKFEREPLTSGLAFLSPNTRPVDYRFSSIGELRGPCIHSYLSYPKPGCSFVGEKDVAAAEQCVCRRSLPITKDCVPHELRDIRIPSLDATTDDVLSFSHEEFDKLYKAACLTNNELLIRLFRNDLMIQNKVNLAIDFDDWKAVMNFLLIRKNRRSVRYLSYKEWVVFHFKAWYMRFWDLFTEQCEPPFGKNNVKIYCLNNGGEYLNVDRKLFIQASPVFSDMLKHKPTTKYLSIPAEYKVLRWCMKVVHGVDISWERPFSIRRIDSMFHLAHEFQIDPVINVLMMDIINEDLLYLTWNYKHREATRCIYEKHNFHEIGKIMHSEKFRGKKYTVPALDFAALWDLKIKFDQTELKRIAFGPDSSRWGKCPFCALADLPYSMDPVHSQSFA